MKQEIPTPIFAAIIAVAVLVVGFVLWRHYSEPATLPAGMTTPSYHTGSTAPPTSERGPLGAARRVLLLHQQLARRRRGVPAAPSPSSRHSAPPRPPRRLRAALRRRGGCLPTRPRGVEAGPGQPPGARH